MVILLICIFSALLDEVGHELISNLTENKFLNLADFITVPFVEMKLLFNQKYVKKFRVIPQGFRFDDIKLKEYKKHAIPTFAFSGTIMPESRDLFSLIDYLISL